MKLVRPLDDLRIVPFRVCVDMIDRSCVPIVDIA
jgi:hypothetical protein